MKHKTYEGDFLETPTSQLFDTLAKHTRTLYITKDLIWQRWPQTYQREIPNSSSCFASIYCSHSEILNNPMKAYDRGFGPELLHLFSKMSEFGKRRRKTRALFVLYLDQLSSINAEWLIYLLKITKTDFSLRIFMNDADLAMIKEQLPFQYQLLCDSINSIVFLESGKKKSVTYDLKLPL